MTNSSTITAFATCLFMASVAQAQKADTSGPQPEGPCVPGATTLCIPLDATFTVVNMDGNLGGSGPANPLDPCQRNDDDTTGAVTLLFPGGFDLYGQTFGQVFINNNGNVSFNNGFSTFTSTGFPVNGFPMVAPFWADVDTRPLTSGTVYFKSELHRLTVIWDHVGYYNQQADKLNTFELIMSDGLDPVVGIGRNVCFCYDDMQWTTGSASGGVGGFGGVPATVGVNAGNGINFFLIGRFDHAGVDYDGPGGNADGVSFLDGQRTCFSVGSLENQPPIFVNPPAGCLMASAGVPLSFAINAISPEANQTTTITVDPHGLANFSCITTPGNPATANCTFTPGGFQVGTFMITYTACDNFGLSTCTSIDVCITVAECHLLLSAGVGHQQVPIFGHLYDTQLTSIRHTFPVTMTNYPSFRVPGLHHAPGGLDLYPAPYFVQVVMYNPQVFPNNPSQWSKAMEVTPYIDGTVGTLYHGTANGIGIRALTFVDANGVNRVKFPFVIWGM